MKSTRSAPHIRASGVILTALATASLAGMLAPARAADPATGDEQASRLVQYGDLDLNSQEGVARLYQRIEMAAGDVCGNDSRTRELADWSRARRCAMGSISQAVAKVGNPALTTLHSRKTARLNPHKTLLSRR